MSLHFSDRGKAVLVKSLSLDRLSGEARRLLLANNINTFALGLGSFFLNVFLIRQIDNFSLVVLFNLVQFPSTLFGHLFGAFSPTRFRAKQFLRLGIGVYILVYLILILSGPQLFRLVLPLGMLYGLANGFYWAGNNLLVCNHTQDENRDSYYAINFAVTSGFSVLVPAVSGFIVSRNYNLLFILTVLIFAVSLYLTTKLPDVPIGKVEPWKLKLPLKSKVWRLLGTSLFVEGLKVGSEGFVSAFLLLTVLTKELNMGIIQSLFSLFGILFGLVLSKRLNKETRLPGILFGASLFVLAHLLLTGFFSVTGILLNMLILLIGSPLYNIGISSVFLEVLEKTPDYKEHLGAYFLFKETMSLSGRIFGAFLFLVFLRFGGLLPVAKVWYLFLGFVPLFYGIYLYLIQKTLNPSLRLFPQFAWLKEANRKFLLPF